MSAAKRPENSSQDGDHTSKPENARCDASYDGKFRLGATRQRTPVLQDHETNVAMRELLSSLSTCSSCIGCRSGLDMEITDTTQRIDQITACMERLRFVEQPDPV